MSPNAAHRLLVGVLCFILMGWSTPASGPVQITQGPVGELGPAVSPNGRWLAIEYFTLKHPNDPEIWIMPSKGRFSDAKPILNDASTIYGEIAWSPDSDWISFISKARRKSPPSYEQVFKVNVKTKEIMQLTHLDKAIMGGGTSWSNDGRIIFAMYDGIYVLSASGGIVTKLLDVQGKLGPVEPDFPVWSPDALHLAFIGRRPEVRDFEPDSHGRDLYIADVRTGSISKVFSDIGDDSPSWLDDSHVLVSHQDSLARSSLWLVPISGDGARLLTSGFSDAVPAISRPPDYLYFSRNEEDVSKIQQFWKNGQFVKGFHIWRQKFDFGRGPRSHPRR